MEAEAFGYINGKLYFGHNHLQVATQAFADGQIDASQLPTQDYMSQQGPMAFGWIKGDEVEFYSDHYEYEQQSLIFDDVFKKIQKKYPQVTEMTMGKPEAIDKWDPEDDFPGSLPTDMWS